MIAAIDGKLARIHLGDGTGPKPFKIAQLRTSPLTLMKSYD